MFLILCISFQLPVQEFPLVIFFFFPQDSICQKVQGGMKAITLLFKPHPLLQERQEELPGSPGAACFGRLLRKVSTFLSPKLRRVFFRGAIQSFLSVAEFSEQLAEFKCKGEGKVQEIATDNACRNRAISPCRAWNHFLPLPAYSCPKTVKILSVGWDHLEVTASPSLLGNPPVTEVLLSPGERAEDLHGPTHLLSAQTPLALAESQVDFRLLSAMRVPGIACPSLSHIT